jgi:glycine cleavage system H protein
MSEVPAELLYTESHEWISVENEGIVRIGVTDHAQGALGDLVFVELPEVGTDFGQGDACAVVESVKAASDIYSPVSGEVLSINDALEDDPELINQHPYGDGWLFTIRISDESELDTLKDAEAYAETLED